MTSPLLTAIKGPSVREPYAWAITRGWKLVENRTWPTRFRGPVLIHAGLREERDDVDSVIRLVARQTGMDPRIVEQDYRQHRHLGAIVGAATITDCVEDLDNDWFYGPHGFVLADAVACQPVPCRGALSFFAVPPEVLARVRAGNVEAEGLE